ncbi:MAG: hydroxymethylglutaryl-CoA lyase [Leptospiraceae bacterium]|nr:hydroxymethylglutaryl-CoA lyase [Leptospiraceae bacterium]
MSPQSAITIYEVGPRDGLQNESASIASADKIEYINRLSTSGLTRIEATSFVRAGIIPQLADAGAVMAGIKRNPAIRYAALVPNVKGLEHALAHETDEICVFTAASDAFSQKNTNATIAESLQRIRAIRRALTETGQQRPIRGYVSTVIECPYSGQVSAEQVLEVCKQLLDLGIYQISLGETIGTAVPDEVARLLDLLCKHIPAEKLAGHFHDTRGTALANVMRSLEYGLRSFDSSSAGLGGCPYAPGAAGNLATEDLVYALHRSGYQTGVDLNALHAASRFIMDRIGRPAASRVYQALQKRTAY